MIGTNYHSAQLFYTQLRGVTITADNQNDDDSFQGAVEVDESYFGGMRKGKRGRGAEALPAKFLFSGYCSRKRARSGKRGGKETMMPGNWDALNQWG